MVVTVSTLSLVDAVSRAKSFFAVKRSLIDLPLIRQAPDHPYVRIGETLQQ